MVRHTVGAAPCGRPRARPGRSGTGPYGKTGGSPYFLGAGVLPRPPFSAAQLEPHRNKGAFNQGSAMLPTTAQSAAAKDEEKVVS